MSDRHEYERVIHDSKVEKDPLKSRSRCEQMADRLPSLAEQGQASGDLTKLVKRWEVFPGRNRFLCDGRIMLSSQTGIFYFTLFLIIGTSGCFFAIDAYYCWVNLSPTVPIIAALLVIFVISTLCRTAIGDPGILPRATPAEVAETERLIAQDSDNKTAVVPPRVQNVRINGVDFSLKYCYTCKIFRPPRASHCSVCDNCVDRFDHHCPWVGNCVGRRNYKYFYLFLVSLTVLCAYLLAFSVTCIILRSKETSFTKAMEAGPLSPIVALVAFFSVFSVAGLGFFHTYLTANNMTTNEDIKGTFKKKEIGNPFSAGSCFANFALVLCGPLPPSLIDRRGYVTAEDIPPAKQTGHVAITPASLDSRSANALSAANRSSNANGPITKSQNSAQALSNATTETPTLLNGRDTDFFQAPTSATRTVAPFNPPQAENRSDPRQLPPLTHRSHESLVHMKPQKEFLT